MAREGLSGTPGGPFPGFGACANARSDYPGRDLRSLPSLLAGLLQRAIHSTDHLVGNSASTKSRASPQASDTAAGYRIPSGAVESRARHDLSAACEKQDARLELGLRDLDRIAMRRDDFEKTEKRWDARLDKIEGKLDQALRLLPRPAAG